jgi:protein-tyrosine phosphatase
MRILFVCLGNICRSPSAEAVLREIAAREAPELGIEVDSAGTAGYHIGEPPDERSQEAARRRGYDMTPLRARIVEPDDFERFDLILAMDRGHLSALQRMAPDGHRAHIRLFMPERDVPDPYYGGPEGFEEVLNLVEAACRDLLRELKATS